MCPVGGAVVIMAAITLPVRRPLQLQTWRCIKQQRVDYGATNIVVNVHGVKDCPGCTAPVKPNLFPATEPRGTRTML